MVQYTAEDLPYMVDSTQQPGAIYCCGLHTGEPTEREIYHRKLYRKEHGQTSGIHKQCPCCGSKNTDYLREVDITSWYCCYDCDLAFTFEDAHERFIDITDEPNPFE
jgi:hypothetical protein